MSYPIAVANALLDHTFGVSTMTPPQAWYVQLHYGEPGADGTENAWSAAGRSQCTNWEVATAGWIRNGVDITWNDLPNPAVNDSIAFFSAWTLSSGGICVDSGRLVRQDGESVVVAEGDSFVIPAYYLLVQWVT